MRFPRYQADLYEASQLIDNAKKNPDDLDLLLCLHCFLIRKITKEERRIRRLKAARARLTRIKKSKRLSKIESKNLKSILKKIQPRLNARNILIFTWKCFGDGIAYIYQDGNSLKHLYYDKDYNVKESAGFLSGKEGFKAEWSLFRKALQYKIPAVLSDITNVVRHGDVCFLLGNDPMPVEVKKTIHKNPGERVERQKEQIYKINSFYENDFAPSFRNGTDTARITLNSDEVVFYKEINEVIVEALNKGFAYQEVEAGLTYFCIRTDQLHSDNSSLGEVLNKVGYGNRTLVTELLPNDDWGIAYPFTLSLDPENLVAFIQNEICINIFVDLEELREEYRKYNVHAKFVMDGEAGILLSYDPDNLMLGATVVSEPYLVRMLWGFVSMKWLASESNNLLDAQKVLRSKFPNNFPDVDQVDDESLRYWSGLKDILSSNNNVLYKE